MISTPRYSVVITAHNAAGTIGATLRSLARQNGVAEGELEIVLVDDRSTDGTLEVARATGVPHLRLIRVDVPAGTGLTTRQEALALGMEAARARIVLVTDADGIASPDWVKRMSEAVEEGRADAVAGGVSFRAESGWLGMWQTVDQAVYISICRILNALGFGSGVLFGSFAFRRRLFGEIGGFGSIGYTLTEDLAFARVLHAHGYRIGYLVRPLIEVAACESWNVLIERAKRVSSGGVSALAIAIGAWMALLLLSAIGALAFGGWMAWLFAGRYALGALHAGWALLANGNWRLVPLALLYEPVAIGVGALVMVRLWRSSDVEWGGNRYAR